MRDFLQLGVRDDQPDLALAQFRAFSRQIPPMYVILMLNAAALALTFLGTAPAVLTIWVPVALALVCVGRLARWWHARFETVTPQAAIRQLRLLVVLTFMLGLYFTVWAVSLYGYGDTTQRLHVAYFVSASVFACTICLTYLRAAAIGLLATATATMVGRLLLEPYGVSTAIAFNALVVAVVLMRVVSRNHADFANLIDSQKVLAERRTEAVRLLDENRELAVKDALTGLPNRRWFFAELKNAVDHALDTGAPHPVVAVIDLDGFKPVNDLHGHSAGDRILVEVARRLGRFANEQTRIARLGGDEFAIIMCDIEAREQAQRLGETICRDLGQIYEMGDFTVQVAASIGLSEIGAHNRSGIDLYEQGDYALNYAKRAARGCVTFFTHEHAEEIREASRVDQALRAADFERELYLDYQPIVDSRTGTIVAFEALGRWTSPWLGSVAPAIFIDAAERCGQIGAITEELLWRMLNEMGRWPEHVRLSFNLSVHDICSTETMAAITCLLKASGHALHRIDFEITETSVMHDFERALVSFDQLKQLGCGIALDDFGTGYSSLSYVHRLPLDKIKIDRSFLRDLGRDAKRFAVLRSILGLCENLRLDCVVEGVEEAEQRQLICCIGHPLMQGYLFGRPCSQDDALALLAQAARSDRAATLGEAVAVPGRDVA